METVDDYGQGRDCGAVTLTQCAVIPALRSWSGRLHGRSWPLGSGAVARRGRGRQDAARWRTVCLGGMRVRMTSACVTAATLEPKWRLGVTAATLNQVAAGSHGRHFEPKWRLG